MHVFLKLATSRAVEFFIRDKYEKKKYYDKNAVNAFNVSKHFNQELSPFFWKLCKRNVPNIMRVQMPITF